MSIIGSNILAGASGQAGYNINNSLRFRSSNSAFLSRTPGTAGSRTTWTWSAWVKRGALGSPTKELFTASTSGEFFFGTTDTLTLYDNATTYLTTTQVFRDPSAWYHIVLVWDTTQATSSNRIKMYVNGTQVTAFGTASYPVQNTTSSFNNNTLHNIGEYFGGGAYHFDGYMTEINFVDGSALTPSSFGETSTTTGQWIPKKYTSTYGTNGFYLKFADASAATAAAIGKDSSGNGNNWTPSGISVTAGVTYDAMIDVPTNTSATVANYCTLNPLRYGITYVPTLSEGNLKVAWAGDPSVIIGTMNIPSSGKWYWEAVVPTQTYNFLALGVVKNQETSNLNTYLGSVTTGYGVYVSTGQKLVAAVSSTYMAIPSQNTVVTVAFDADTGTLYIGAGGSWANGSGSTNQTFSTASSVVTGLTGDISPAFSFNTGNFIVNFGQRPFTYTPPTGYVALNTYNLPTPTILQGNKYMDATLYTGNSTTVTATNAGAFKPDLVWIKDRSAVAQHVLTDSVRGTSAQLFSSLTNAEQSNSTYVTSLNSNGFTVGVGNAGTGVVNNSGDTFVGWQWQAGQGSTSSNTSGSITSTVSVNPTAGFSIVTYTGTGSNATVGHGLGVAPAMMIVKNRSSGSDNWTIYQKATSSTPQNDYMFFTTAAKASASTVWQNTAPTSSVFSIGTSGTVNTNANNFVAYCWAEIAGFSKFGSYTGNGSADGPFVFTGFRPSYILLKRTDAANIWLIGDSKRNGYNSANPSANKQVQAQASNAESNFDIDYLSNGFKLRNTDSYLNASGGTYIYAAFAENPFKNSNAR